MIGLRGRPVVVVEDSEEDFAAFVRAWGKTENKARLVRYTDGEACLAGLRAEEEPRPALVVLDLNLPVQTGREVLREMREDVQLRGIPVVVLTTSAHPGDVQACYELGVGGYILKEGDFHDFCRKIESLNHYWLGAVHLP